MLIKKPSDIRSSEITDRKVYLNRRLFMRGAVLAGSAAATSFFYRRLNAPPAVVEARPKIAGVVTGSGDAVRDGFKTTEPLNSLQDITNYNNFYEFHTTKEAVASAARGFVTRPWSVAVEGLVNKARVFDLDDLIKLAPQEERIYRLRCVEGWSMVIPWVGFPLNALLKQVEPLSSARYVAFQTLLDPNRMPNQRTGVLGWPYVEGLRLDEAMHPLTILATGIYGETLPAQNGAPIRLVVPWKYGFKSIKSIVKITLVSDQPPATWNTEAPGEYGFYSNVNPAVSHPRWSQKFEHRIGEYRSRPTLLFNGYAEQVGHLYEGMDLTANY
ncbi:MAG TPA: protein-methionine-sulfoxide reductase catalytic subunit MsrP [Pyrinomonadaceae bacterium]|nr:protein-methionine-sulfoxide reductase catalytic subunit MsrP [Pyrinomonadaceae bacterium]